MRWGRRPVLIAIALVAVVAVALLLRPVVVAFERGARFHTVQYGQSEKSVIDLMGQPDETRTSPPLQCNRPALKAGGPLTTCTKEVTYYGVAIFPEKWLIGMDADSKVVFKYRYVSY